LNPKEEHIKPKQKFSIFGASGYNWVLKNIRFFLFVAFLGVLYIANGHYGDNTIRKINNLGKENKELLWEYKTLNGNLMFQSKQSQLGKAVEPLGLHITADQPIVITDSTVVNVQ
jgi:Bacteriodetes cell division protein (FtsL-like)